MLSACWRHYFRQLFYCLFQFRLFRFSRRLSSIRFSQMPHVASPRAPEEPALFDVSDIACLLKIIRLFILSSLPDFAFDATISPSASFILRFQPSYAITDIVAYFYRYFASRFAIRRYRTMHISSLLRDSLSLMRPKPVSSLMIAGYAPPAGHIRSTAAIRY